MKYVKTNLDVVICVAVALIAIALCFWPTLSWDSQKQDELMQRYQQKKVATNLITNVQVLPPGQGVRVIKANPQTGKWETLPQQTLAHATIEENVVNANKQATEKMKRDAVAVARLAASQNQMGRVIKEEGSETEIPLLAGKFKEPNFLPALVQQADPFGFKQDYEKLFQMWVQQLNGGTPPTTDDITAAENKRLQEIQQQQAAVATVAGNKALAVVTQLGAREKDDIMRALVERNASQIHIYVDAGALQKLPWYGKPVPPNEAQMFEALVNSWFEQDVVNAIVRLNDKVLDKQLPADRNVGHSPVKRLVSVVIGRAALSSNNGGAGGGGLFMAPSDNGNTNTSGPPSAMAAAGSGTGVDKTISLTGHVRSADASGGYDVVPMRIVVDIDPAYQNQFIDSLYRQNNGYTVLNWSIRAIDPLEATSNGYLYGATQAVRMDIVVEGLLFRSWTKPLMPPEIRRMAGIPPEGTVPPGR